MIDIIDWNDLEKSENITLSRFGPNATRLNQGKKTSPLHIELGIVKNFVKAIVRNGNAFGYLKSKFPKLNEAKMKVSVVWVTV